MQRRSNPRFQKTITETKKKKKKKNPRFMAFDIEAWYKFKQVQNLTKIITINAGRHVIMSGNPNVERNWWEKFKMQNITIITTVTRSSPSSTASSEKKP